MLIKCGTHGEDDCISFHHLQKPDWVVAQTESVTKSCSTLLICGVNISLPAFAFQYTVKGLTPHRLTACSSKLG